MSQAPTHEIALSRIAPKPGFNPRQYFDEAALADLVGSIKKDGVVQAITVRPRADDDGFWLVAGERRWRAAQLAGLTMIPAIVRDYDERQAMAAAIAENRDRVGISPAEEAKIARQALDLHEGDEDEAARTLGWAKSVFKARLLLLNACEAVLAAQMAGTIRLGHCELLSTLPEALQQKVLARIVEHSVSVDDLRKQLASFTQELSSAPFDTRGCAGCPKNSTTQASLFEQHVGEGRCSDKTCWDGKVAVHLDEVKAKAAEEYNVVWFDREKAPGSFVRLVREGAGAVGPEQFDACRGCANNGAMVCTQPGKAGRVAADVCFDTDCNTQKVKAYADQRAAEASAPAAEGAAAKAPGTSAPAKKSVKPAAKAAAAAAPKKNMHANLAFLRSVARDAVLASEHLTLACDVFALSRAVKLDRKVLGLGNGEYGVRSFIDMDDATLAQHKRTLLTMLFDAATDAPGNYTPDDTPNAQRSQDAVSIIGREQVALSGRFKLDQAYLETLTKSGIEALLREAGFAASLAGDTDDARQKALGKFLSQGRADLIKAVLASGFDFSAFVPSAVTRLTAKPSRGAPRTDKTSVPEASETTTTEETSDAE